MADHAEDSAGLPNPRVNGEDCVENRCYANCALRVLLRAACGVALFGDFAKLECYLAGKRGITAKSKAEAGEAVNRIQCAVDEACSKLAYSLLKLSCPFEFLNDMFELLSTGDEECALREACRVRYATADDGQLMRFECSVSLTYTAPDQPEALGSARATRSSGGGAKLMGMSDSAGKVKKGNFALTKALEEYSAHHEVSFGPVMIVHVQTHYFVDETRIPVKVTFDVDATANVGTAAGCRCYAVIGFVVSRSAAHYTCYVRTRYDDEQWLRCDDMKDGATRTSRQAAQDASKDATLIFYRRIDPALMGAKPAAKPPES